MEASGQKSCYKFDVPVIFKNGNILVSEKDRDDQALSPDMTLTDLEARELFELCRQNQGLLSGGSCEVRGFPLEITARKDHPVILFPGSFSPWHKGHEACLRNLPQGKEGVRVVVLPDFNPWKEVRKEGLWQECSEVWHGLETIAQERRDLNLSLYLGFLAGEHPNPTIDWLPKIKGDDIWLLMGEDSFLNLHQWKEVDSLLSSLNGLYICPRAADQKHVLAQKTKILELAPDGFSIEFLAPHPYEDYSSTWLRQRNSSED